MKLCAICYGDGCPTCQGSGLMSEHRRERLLGQLCRVCGCHELLACPGGCGWVEADLCSGCADESRRGAVFGIGVAEGGGRVLDELE